MISGEAVSQAVDAEHSAVCRLPRSLANTGTFVWSGTGICNTKVWF